MVAEGSLPSGQETAGVVARRTVADQGQAGTGKSHVGMLSMVVFRCTCHGLRAFDLDKSSSRQIRAATGHNPNDRKIGANDRGFSLALSVAAGFPLFHAIFTLWRNLS